MFRQIMFRPSKARQMISCLTAVALALAAGSRAQVHWEVQDSQVTASLRGIHSVDASISWASGSDGTILRTVDGGAHWQKCAIPPDGDKFDFRGIWAWDANSAIVMSSGPGDQSRLYSTSDGCAHWKEDRRNRDADGFWDAVVFQTQDFGLLGDGKTGVLIGDPVHRRFHTEVVVLGHGWFIDDDSCTAQPNEAAFAASNSAVFVFGSRRYIIATGGKSGPRVLLSPLLAYKDSSKSCLEIAIPLAGGSESSGAFSLSFRDLTQGVVVGGDYKRPDDPTGTAAWTGDGGRHWTASAKPPHGYRSAVAFDVTANAWIAVGTNGSDISNDDGKTWHPIDDGRWGAISPPYAVGPNGRIARLR
jgi:photosystem II stability/assembly factor-like uncharacterized protein